VFSKLIHPQYPTTALGLEKESAAVVQLQKAGRGQFRLRRAATIDMPDYLLNPSFDEKNINDSKEFAEVLIELTMSAGLGRQRKWSVALPEATTRSVVMTMETKPSSHNELEEVLQWKIERAFGASYGELRVSRNKLSPDSKGQERYLAVGIKHDVLAEYESIFETLGWHAGLILPRYFGESRWLEMMTEKKTDEDSLLISSHNKGFTAMLIGNAQPVVIRSVLCEDDYDDELYRFLLFCRDRVFDKDAATTPRSLQSFLLVGHGFTKERVKQIVSETLGTKPRALDADDVGLVNLLSSRMAFDEVAAAAGMATLAW
jgi:Tfp pilus assembly PilM family ATPase